MSVHCIGVAGYMGAGKSTCARLLAAPGILLIDADREAKALLRHDEAIREKLMKTFGSDIIAHDSVRSDLLGDRAFQSGQNLGALNAIVHPALLARLGSLIDNCDTGRCILDAALIPMWDMGARFDFCIWVTASFEVRLGRLSRKIRDVSEATLRTRMALQEQTLPPPVSPSWHVVRNEGSLQELESALREVPFVTEFITGKGGS